MASPVVSLTRELIAKFATDQRTIKFFEQLQGYIIETLPADLTGIIKQITQAQATADDADVTARQALFMPPKQDPLTNVPIPSDQFSYLPDVPVNQPFQNEIPNILIPNGDTRKYDQITSSYGTRWVGSSSGLTINTSEVDLTAALGTGAQTDIGISPFTYDSGANAFFVSKEFIDSYFFDIVLRLSGTSPSPAAQSQPITFFLRRSDGSLITTSDYVMGRGLSGTLTNETVQLPTFVFAGGSDPYQVLGFRISAAGGNAGWSLTDKTLFLKR